MSHRLRDNLNSRYFEAANNLKPKNARRRIIAYVESYDDVYFWRTVLSSFENDTRYFEVMLPSRSNLTKGKKSVLMNFIGDRMGEDMIACVDADYDYLMQGATQTSDKILSSPYVFHTYVYAIENYQCYAQSLHDVCVMVTLNDHSVFDFVDFMQQYSEACYPLFVWSILLYRRGLYKDFTISDFCKVVELGGFNMRSPEKSINNLRNKVYRRAEMMRRHYPSLTDSYDKMDQELRQLGITPDTTYLYIQGHHIFDNIVAPILGNVCEYLRRERENQIYRQAVHNTQMHNELSCYEHSIEDIPAMLKKNFGYINSPQFVRLKQDVANYLENGKDQEQIED
jgi:hypothetical protein